MRLMKKDMGGSALVLALAHVIMSAQLPVKLRVLVPAVENAISGNAYRSVLPCLDVLRPTAHLLPPGRRDDKVIRSMAQTLSTRLAGVLIRPECLSVSAADTSLQLVAHVTCLVLPGPQRSLLHHIMVPSSQPSLPHKP
jgi:hypothetical protein